MNSPHPPALMDESFPAESFADIWVALPDAGAAPLLNEARRLADLLGCYVHAVVPDESLQAQAIALGADRVHPVGVAGLASFLANQLPEFAFLPTQLEAEAAQLAQRLRGGLISDARNLGVEDSTRALVASHPVYGGDYFLDVAVSSPAKIATLDPRLLAVGYADESRSGEIVPAPGQGSPPPAAGGRGS